MNIPNASPALHNADVAPATQRKWGAFSIFNGVAIAGAAYYLLPMLMPRPLAQAAA
jgi:hypothetical protein